MNHDAYVYNEHDALVMWLAVPPHDESEMQFQPRFCKKCGNYIFRKPLCTC